jgi:uncharacterized membrane protein YfcA
MPGPDTLLIIATFFIAGMVKGVIGLGLPTVSLALLALAFELPTAMALLLVPSFATNLWQALVGSHIRVIAQRLWPFMLMATISVWIGAMALTRIEPAALAALLGGLLILYAAVSLAGIRVSVPVRIQAWLGPLLGLVNGILTGMTGSFVVPGVMYLQSIGLARDLLIQAMGVLFALSTLALALALHSHDLLSIEQGGISAAALLPAVAGMAFGQRIRRTIPEQRFRKIFYLSLLTLGACIIFNATGSQ